MNKSLTLGLSYLIIDRTISNKLDQMEWVVEICLAKTKNIHRHALAGFRVGFHCITFSVSSLTDNKNNFTSLSERSIVFMFALRRSTLRVTFCGRHSTAICSSVHAVDRKKTWIHKY